MLPSPAMKITIMRPMLHSDMKMKAGLDMSGSDSQRWAGTPKMASRLLMMPESG